MDNELHALEGNYPIMRIGIDLAHHSGDSVAVALIGSGKYILLEDYTYTISGRHITDDMLYPKMQNFPSGRDPGWRQWDNKGRRRR